MSPSNIVLPFDLELASTSQSLPNSSVLRPNLRSRYRATMFGLLMYGESIVLNPARHEDDPCHQPYPFNLNLPGSMQMTGSLPSSE